jgi:hypothetical protein
VRQNFSKKEMITLLNNRVKRGEIANTSIILMVLKIKQNMGRVTVMVTAMVMVGPYSNGYHDDENPKSLYQKLKKEVIKRWKNA